MQHSTFKIATLFIVIIVNAACIPESMASGKFDEKTGTFKCSNGMPEFTGSRSYGYTNSQARKTCSCIKDKYVVSGWEKDVWIKVKRGDTSDWRTGALMSRMKSAVNICTKENGV
jgi:hypothetical protein